jgi:hypothetical protein
MTNAIALVKGPGEALARASLLPILETFNVLTGEYREMTRAEGLPPNTKIS